MQTKGEWLEQYNPGRMKVFHTRASTENGNRGGFRSQVRDQSSLLAIIKLRLISLNISFDQEVRWQRKVNNRVGYNDLLLITT